MQRDDLDQPWKIENLRRSLTMLPPGAPGLCREDAILVLELLAEQGRGSLGAQSGPGDGPT